MKTNETIRRIQRGLNELNDTAIQLLDLFLERVGDSLDEFTIVDYYAGDLKIFVNSMEELATVFKALMKSGYSKPQPFGVDIREIKTTASYKIDNVYIILKVPSDEIPEELIGDCRIEEIDIPEEVRPARTERVLVCNRDV